MSSSHAREFTDELAEYVNNQSDLCDRIDLSVIKEFLDKGAEVNMLSEFSGEKYPAYLGVLLGAGWRCKNTQQEIEELAHLFIKRGADIDKKIKGRMTPVAECLSGYVIRSALALLRQDVDVFAGVDLLELATQIPCEEKEDGETLLAVVNKLLEKGYEAGKFIQNTKTLPIILAAEHGQIEVVKELIKRGADVNQADAKGVTPLMYACGLPIAKDWAFMQTRPLELITLLVESGADATLKSNKKRDALSIFKKTTVYPEGEYTAEEVKEKITNLLEKSIKTFS